MEPGVRAASLTGISGSCERDTCSHRAQFPARAGVVAVVSPRGITLRILTSVRVCFYAVKRVWGRLMCED